MAHAASFGIGNPMGPAASNAGSAAPAQSDAGSAAAMQQGLVLDLMGQLTEANKTILEMSMKCAALKKELDMEKKYKQLSIDHAVAQAKWDWEAQWQRVEELQARAASSAAAQPGSKPPPAPGFEAPKAEVEEESQVAEPKAKEHVPKPA